MLNKSMAKLCLRMCARDQDGQYIIHYLGNAFKEAVSHAVHDHLYGKALQFINNQLELHRASGNTKLSSRYESLLAYFEESSTN
jgi:hypothetical protein